MHVYLVVAAGKRQGTPIRLKVDLFVLGSAADCQLRAALPGVAPRHCAVVVRGRQVFVRGLDDAPTLVNGTPVPHGEEFPLHPGDRLSVGPLEFLVQFRDRPRAELDADGWARQALAAYARQGAQEADGPHALEPSPGASASASAAAAAILDRLHWRRGVVKGRLRVSAEGGVTVLRLSDSSLVNDTAIALVKRDIGAAVGRPDARVLLDLKSVRRMSAKAADMILDVFRAVRGQGGSLSVCRVRSEIRGVFHALRLFQVVPHYHDKQEALAARW
jgi:anti-anti-sigma regulatory factor